MNLKHSFLFILLHFVASQANPLGKSTNPTVKIGDGELMGRFETSVSGKQHSAFLGIPFAQPPVISYSIS